RLQLQVYRNRVPLVRAHAQPALVEGETLLVVARHHLVKLRPCDRHAARGGSPQQGSNVYPATRLQRDAEGFWLMAQILAQKLADPDESRLFHRFLGHCAWRHFRSSQVKHDALPCAENRIHYAPISCALIPSDRPALHPLYARAPRES